MKKNQIKGSELMLSVPQHQQQEIQQASSSTAKIRDDLPDILSINYIGHVLMTSLLLRNA